MGLLGMIGQRLMVISARQQIKSGSGFNVFHVQNPKTQEAVNTLMKYSKEVGDHRLAARYQWSPPAKGGQ